MISKYSDEERSGSRAPRRRAVVVAVTVALVAAAIVAGYLAHRGHDDADASDARPGKANSRVVALGDEAAIVLGAAAESRADIGTTPIRAVEGAAGDPSGSSIVLPGVELAGELVADPARVTSIRSPVPGKLSSASWPALDARIAAGQPLGQVSDAKPLTAPRSGTVIRVGAQPGEFVQAGEELLVLADFSAPLVRIVWRPEFGRAPPQTLTVAPLVASGAPAGMRARLVGAAADVDSVTRMPVYLYRLADAWAGARPGTLVTAIAPDTRAAANTGARSATAGVRVFVPTAAVIQWEGLAWAFVQRGARSYVRARVMSDHPIAGGYVVTAASSGLAPGDLVVTRGAQQLLSEEFRTHVQMGDEGDDEK
jgi:biotin carboxyl carrier protein